MVFHMAKSYYKRHQFDGNKTPRELLEEGLRTACSPQAACNLFQHSNINVDDPVREWAIGY